MSSLSSSSDVLSEISNMHWQSSIFIKMRSPKNIKDEIKTTELTGEDRVMRFELELVCFVKLFKVKTEY